jgi:RNA polymerase sigma factor (sigma-70 family)
VIGNDPNSRRERSDAELLGASAELADAFDTFYRRHYRPVLKYIASRVGDTAAALDLTAEVFAAAYIGRSRFREGRGPARGWLFGIAANKITDLYRQKRREDAARRRLGMERRSYTDAALEEAEAMIGATQLLDDLPVLERDAVLARVIHDRAYDEIATEAQVAPATVRKRVSDGLARLARIYAAGPQNRAVDRSGHRWPSQVAIPQSRTPS